jgi:hypothetical protein
MMKKKLDTVRLQPFRDMGGAEIILDFNNDRHHAIRLPRGMRPDQIANVLEDLAVAIRRDEKLRDT